MGSKSGVNVFDVLTTSSAVQVGVHKVSHDGTRADDCDLNRKIVKFARLHDWESGHLCARLNLEGPHGVGSAEEIVSGGIVFRDFGKIDRAATSLANSQSIFHRGQHPEP
jgi:hypothetical protein